MRDRAVIRCMEQDDLEQVAKLEKSLFTDAWSAQSFADCIRSEHYCFLTAEYEGRVIGYCGYLRSFEEADIVNVAVEKTFQNRGTGREMLERLTGTGYEKGIRRFFLEVRRGNAAALHLYRSMGFEQVGCRKRYYTDPVEDAIVMMKQMPSSGQEQKEPAEEAGDR